MGHGQILRETSRTASNICSWAGRGSNRQVSARSGVLLIAADKRCCGRSVGKLVTRTMVANGVRQRIHRMFGWEERIAKARSEMEMQGYCAEGCRYDGTKW